MIATQPADTGWLLFVTTLSGGQGAARIRLWRSLKTLGAATVRDGVYALPARDDLEALVREYQAEIAQLGGTALIFRVGAEEDADFKQLFDRETEYVALSHSVAEFTEGLWRRSEVDARRALRQLKRELQSIEAIDYFPGDTRERARNGLREAEARFTQTFSPGEPTPDRRVIAHCDSADYLRKVWATRRRPWVDRVASAWLIRRFIDPYARFMWLASPSDCPKDAIGFDFDGATFTHVDERVTFEVLLESFGLSNDPALQRLGEMVRALDTGAASTVPESAGFETLLSGARDVFESDDALLEHMRQSLDALYAGFSKSVSARAISGRTPTP